MKRFKRKIIKPHKRKIRKPLKVRKLFNKATVNHFIRNGFTVELPVRGIAYGFLASYGNSEFEVHYLNERSPHVMVDWKLSQKKTPKFGHEEYKTNTDVMLSAVDFIKRWKRANKKAKEN